MPSRRCLSKGLFVLLLLAGSLRAQDFTHLHLDLSLDTLTQAVKGRVELRLQHLQPGDSVFLNGIRMEYQAVTWNDEEVAYRPLDTGLWILPAAQLSWADTNRIAISYRATPRKGLYFIGFDDETGRSRRQIWTQGQGIDHRHWIPHRDDQRDKVIFSLKVRFAAPYTVVSNGRLIETKTEQGLKHWHYAMEKPMSSYLIALAIGRYDSLQSRSAQGIPLCQYYYPDRTEDYPHYYRHNEAIFAFFEERIPYPFPWANYKQVPVQDFRHGAMENTTATIFGDFFLVDEIAFADRNYTYVNAHELAHQWFGNLVTATGSKHHWLHEGFATYYQWLSERNLYGQDHFDWERHLAAEQVFAASQADTFALAHPQAGSARFYQKGAWVLYQLENMLGYERWQAAIADYLQSHAYGLVATDSLRLILEKHCRCALDTFFQQWVSKPGEPAVAIRAAKKGGQYGLEIRMDRPWQVDLVIRQQNQSGESRRDTLHTDGQKSEFFFALPEKENELTYWAIENGDAYLWHLSVFKSMEMWQAHYRDEPRLLNRLRAVKAMERFTSRERRPFLEEVLRDTLEHFGPRSVALELLLDGSPEKLQQAYLLTALGDRKVNLQKAAAQACKNAGPAVRERLEYLRRHGRSYTLRNLALQLTVNFERPEQNRWLQDSFWARNPGIPGEEVYISTLVYRLLLFQEKEAYEALKLRCSPAFDFLTRMNAIEALAALQIIDDEGVAFLFAAYFHPNWKLSSTARRALERLYQSPHREKLENYREANADTWNDFQERRAARIFEG